MYTQFSSNNLKNALFLMLLLSSIICVKIQKQTYSIENKNILLEQTLRNNEVNMQDITDISFRNTKLVATTGQPTGSVTTFGRLENNYYTVQDSINVQAGRKGSEEVANKFNNSLNPRVTSTFGDTAGKLNFYVTGDLKIKLKDKYYEFKDVYFAQGQSGSTNNWWFGGKNCKKVNGKLEVITIIMGRKASNEVWGNIVECNAISGEKVYFVRGRVWATCENGKAPQNTAVNSVRIFSSKELLYDTMSVGATTFCYARAAFEGFSTQL